MSEEFGMGVCPVCGSSVLIEDGVGSCDECDAGAEEEKYNQDNYNQEKHNQEEELCPIGGCIFGYSGDSHRCKSCVEGVRGDIERKEKLEKRI
jgi:hypothetical protein